MRKLSKNAIIIIGNGFDLAHNMKTSYNDFADYYISEIIAKKLEKLITICPKQEDSFFKNSLISLVENYKSPPLYDPLNVERWKAELEINKKLAHSFPKSVTSLIEKLVKSPYNIFHTINEYLKENKSDIKHIIQNEFLGKLYNNEYENWFDIEKAYFSELKLYANKNSLSEVQRLNGEFNEIKSNLKNYLNQIEKNKDEDINTFFANNFLGKENIYVINFNYTDTFKFYKQSLRHDLKENNPVNVEVNHIHGTLKEDIIFGYGDDTNQEYQIIKDKDCDEYLKNFKTTSYLLTDSYIKILNNIEDFDDYEAYVIGHSLGRTDKTLLKEIFDNKSCLNIHLFKRRDLVENIKSQKDVFSILTNNILRIISKESDSRRKIVSFESSLFFPHPNENYHTEGYFEKDFRKIYSEKEPVGALFL